MAMDFGVFKDDGAGLTADLLDALVERHERDCVPRFERFWDYYRNPLVIDSDGDTRLAQERGLPARLAGVSGSCRGWSPLIDDRAGGRKEIVIENDIAWRIHTMVDFMFGRPIAIRSFAKDEARRRAIEEALDAVWEASGGIGLLQDMALLGHVYGHVDLVVRAAPGSAGNGHGGNAAERAAASVRIEIVDPTRGIALQSASDYRRLSAFIIRSARETLETEPAAASPAFARGTGAPGLLRRLVMGAGKEQHPASAPERRRVIVTEILSGRRRRVYEQSADAGEKSVPVLIDEGPALVTTDRRAEGAGSAPAAAPTPPVVHIQNISQPLVYEGVGEVEPLIPLQDELNTRLSDRASRVTLQSFRMLLAKGLGGLDGLTVAPGVIVQTDNPQAHIESFGGDSASPSEERHIDEVREAMDKVSAVPPLAAGVVRAKIGNLSSENALRVTLLGLLSKTARKRITYGRGIAEASRLILEALDLQGILRTTPGERSVRVEWPEALPRDEGEVLEAALKKVELGVPRDRILTELGYAPEASQSDAIG